MDPDVTIAQDGDISVSVQTLNPYSSGEIQIDFEGRHLVVPLTHGAQQLANIVRELDNARISLESLALRRPTLDDVFLSLTGHALIETDRQKK